MLVEEHPNFSAGFLQLSRGRGGGAGAGAGIAFLPLEKKRCLTLPLPAPTQAGLTGKVDRFSGLRRSEWGAEWKHRGSVNAETREWKRSRSVRLGVPRRLRAPAIGPSGSYALSYLLRHVPIFLTLRLLRAVGWGLSLYLAGK